MSDKTNEDRINNAEIGRIASPGSERVILATIFKDFDKIIKVLDIVQASDFISQYNANIYRIMLELFTSHKTNKLDKYIIAETAKEKGLKIFPTEDKTGEYIDTLMDMVVESENIRQAAARVKKAAVKREFYKKAREVQHELLLENDESLSEIVSRVQNAFFSEIKSLADDNKVGLLTEGVYELAKSRADNPQSLMGISTGFNRFDKIMGGGIRRGSLDIIIGRAKSGKSCFLLQVAYNMAIKDKSAKVLYLDTEQDAEQQKFRLLSQAANVPIYDIETGKWRATKESVDAINLACKKIDNSFLYYTKVVGKSPEEICNIIRQWTLKELKYDKSGKVENAVVILDYIKIMSKVSMKNINEWQYLGLMTSQFKDLAEDLDISMISAAQANRGAIGISAGAIDASLIAASDRLSWYATSCSILAPKLFEEIEEDGFQFGNIKLVVLLSRFGPGQDYNDYLNYEFSRKTSLKFKELESNIERLSGLKNVIEKNKKRGNAESD